jgi:Zn finger protein HypA/HybF involved in hydrogenase expression
MELVTRPIPCVECNKVFLAALESKRWVKVTCPNCGAEFSVHHAGGMTVENLRGLTDDLMISSRKKSWWRRLFRRN